MNKNIRVGIGQFAPVHFSLIPTLQKLEAIMRQASQEKVELLVMGETWLSGYPAWLDHCPNIGRWNDDAMKTVYQKMVESSIAVDGNEAKQLSELARQFRLHLAIGVNEKVMSGRGNGTLYNSLLLFNKEGMLVNHHRKLVPTFTEKLLYGPGDGQGLKAVDTTLGRIGGNICWEHWMPLARQAMHDSGEDIHIALWPTVHEMHQIASRQYAFEGRCFVVAAGQIMHAGSFPSELQKPDYLSGPDALVLNGGSCIVGPDGKYVVEPVFDEERLIVCGIDISKTVREKMVLDTSGHYQRNDVFDFRVNHERKW